MTDSRPAMTMREIRDRVGQLPAPSPALSVHESAARLRGIAEQAAAEIAAGAGDPFAYWSVGWERGIDNAVGGRVGRLAAVFSPDVVLELADWLDGRASANALRGESIPALALAITAATHPPP
jgi:hypothetical protein